MNNIERTTLVNDLRSRINDLQVNIDILRNKLAHVEGDNICYNTTNCSDIIVCSNCMSEITVFDPDDDEPFVSDIDGEPAEINYCPHCGKMFIW